MQPAAEQVSAPDGARNVLKEEEFDPARQAQFVLQNEGLHRGLATESLVKSLLDTAAEVADVMEIPASDADRRMLATILLKEEDEELTAERLEGAVRALRRIHLRRRLEETHRQLKQPGLADDKVRMRELLLEVERLSRALRDPNLGEAGLQRTG
jgi:hypothetical protein